MVSERGSDTRQSKYDEVEFSQEMINMLNKTADERLKELFEPLYRLIGIYDYEHYKY